MNKMTLEQFNSIPDFFHKWRLCIEIDGKIYSKEGIYKLLLVAGMIEG